MKKQPKDVKGIPEVISGRTSLVMQLKKFCGKSCRVYATHVLEEAENEAPRLEDLHVLQEFRDVFLMKFQGFLQRGTLISKLNLCQEQHQCPRHPTG